MSNPVDIVIAYSNLETIVDTVTIKPTRVTKLTCINCLTEVEESFSLHDCGLCLTCCSCSICSYCSNIYSTTELCQLCYSCKKCCSCPTCASCGRAHDKTSMLCASCGAGKEITCGCCQGGKNIPRFKRPVDLERYKPIDISMLKINPNPRLISVELEVAGTRCNNKPLIETLKKWNCSIVNDGSVQDGFEINTHPAGGDYFINLVKSIGSAFVSSNANVDTRCGGHVHIDARDLDYAAMARVIRLFACVEIGLYNIIPYHRRTSNYCGISGRTYLNVIRNAELHMKESDNKRQVMLKYRNAILSNLYGYADKKSVKKSHTHKGGTGHVSRYRGFNLHSWMFRGTIEFRMPPGSVITNNITNWGLLLAHLVSISEKSSMDYIRELVKEIEIVLLKPVDPKNYSESSLLLLKSIAPNNEVKDWISERYNWYKNTNHDIES